MVSLPKEARLAVLIDAENLSAALVKPILARFQAGKAFLLKRAYGDWSSPRIAGWRPVLIEFGIQAMHAPTYTAGKNSADITLAIDAVDLLHQHQIDCFCIISNDSDFTPLAHRLNQSGAKVIGFGSKKASQAFINACHKFIYLEATASRCQEKTDRSTETQPQPLLQIVANPHPIDPNLSETDSIETSNQSTAAHAKLSPKQIRAIVKQAYQNLTSNGEWMTLKKFHFQMQKVCLEQLKLQFSCNLFGCNNLTQLVDQAGLFEWNTQPSTATPAKEKKFRLKRAA